MSRWSEQEIFEMTKLIEKSLQFILIQMGVKNEHAPTISRILITSSRGRITELLNKPLGGLLSPEEIAHMVAVNNQNIISMYDDKACCYSEVAATTAYRSRAPLLNIKPMGLFLFCLGRWVGCFLRLASVSP